MHILDAKRKQNIGIVVRAMKVELVTIRKGILGMDDQVLSLEQLKKLEAIFPTAEEVEQVAEPQRKSPPPHLFFCKPILLNLIRSHPPPHPLALHALAGSRDHTKNGLQYRAPLLNYIFSEGFCPFVCGWVG